MYDGCTIGLSLICIWDNHSIIQQSNIPESKLMKHWNALFLHCIQEADASGFLHLFHIPVNESPADLLTKFLGYQDAIPYLHPLLFGMAIHLIFP